MKPHWLLGALACAAISTPAFAQLTDLSGHPMDQLAVIQGLSAVGAQVVQQNFTGTGCTSKAFTPTKSNFNVSGWGTFTSVSWQLYRSFDQGATKLPITAAGTTLYTWTAAASETASEVEYGVQYYACVNSFSGTSITLRISQ